MRTLMMIALGLASACAPAAKAPDQAAAAPPADTAALRTALNALADQYEAAELSGNAAQVASMYSDGATVVFQGFPSATGKTALEAMFAQAAAAQKTLEMTIETGTIVSPGADEANALGTAVQLVDVGGKKSRMWWRWVGGYRRLEGQWKLNFLMAFQDSTKAE